MTSTRFRFSLLGQGSHDAWPFSFVSQYSINHKRLEGRPLATDDSLDCIELMNRSDNSKTFTAVCRQGKSDCRTIFFSTVEWFIILYQLKPIEEMSLNLNKSLYWWIILSMKNKTETFVKEWRWSLSLVGFYRLTANTSDEEKKNFIVKTSDKNSMRERANEKWMD